MEGDDQGDRRKKGTIRLEVADGVLALEALDQLEHLDLEDPAVQTYIIEQIDSARQAIVTWAAVEAELERMDLDALWEADPPAHWGDDGPPGPPEILS